MAERLTPMYQPPERLTPMYQESKRLTPITESQKTYTTSLNTCKTGNEIRQETYEMRSGKSYILEIVRPATPESLKKYSLDGTRNVNGISRVVSTQKMFVSNIIRGDNMLRFQCRGYDNFGRDASGEYIYYLTPDSQNQRETYILSATPCNR